MNRIKRVLLFLFSLLSGKFACGQAAHGVNWVEGGCYTQKMKFHPGGFVEINPFVTCKYLHQGASCISDSSGKLRLICDGFRLCDSLGNPVDGGDTITPKALCIQQDGWSLYSQASIILPLGNDIYAVVVVCILTNSTPATNTKKTIYSVNAQEA